MGLFRRKQREPRAHVPTQRHIFVPAPVENVRGLLESYSTTFATKGAVGHPMQLGHHGGWTVVAMTGVIHPWAFHNLGFWLLDTPPLHDSVPVGSSTVLRAWAPEGSGPHSGYTLVKDVELDSCLSGQLDDRTPMTVYVPENRINTTDPVPATVGLPLTDPDITAALSTAGTLSVVLEDPGHGLNPDNLSEAASRSEIIPRYHSY